MYRRLIAYSVLALNVVALSAGCGSTRWSDTQRTATEQLLISDAIDRAVSEIDLGALAERKVYLESSAVRQTVDSAYLISTVRQHLLAQGCILVDKLDEADYVVELRAGAVGTDRCDLLFGIPATKLPQSVPVQGIPHTVPELALATKTEQRAVAKIALFAYNRHTGKMVWQSGVIPVESKIHNLWVLGAGPFQRGTVYGGTQSWGQKMRVPFSGKTDRRWQPPIPSVAKEMHFVEDEPQLAERRDGGKAQPLSTEQKAAGAGAVRSTGHSRLSSASSGSGIPPAPPLPAAPPAPPGPVGTSKHHGFGKSLDLTILDHMNIVPAAPPSPTTTQVPATTQSPAATEGASAWQTASQTTAQPATSPGSAPPATAPLATAPVTETSQASQSPPAPEGGAADPASAPPPK